MTENQQNADSLFELGRLYADRGEFAMAVEKLVPSTQLFSEKNEQQKFLKATNLLLRIYAETEKHEEINTIKEKLQDMVLREGFELSSKTYYTLAICASYKGQHETALEYLQKALTIALASDSKEDMCYAINGKVLVYRALGKYNEALKEIYNLEIFYQVLDLPELKISTRLANARILCELKKYDQAIDILWQSYDLVRTQKTMSMHIYLLLYLGRAYAAQGEKDMARLYLNLAWKMIDPSALSMLAKEVKQEIENLGGEGLQNYDLIFEAESNSVIEKKLGRVDFKNQFILLDLLRLFVQNQGQVYSKEYLVQHVWKQDYAPDVHDNKIYVTIKRLRKMIEPDYEKPKYIFRAKNGYFMNKSARVFVEKVGGPI